MTSVSFTCPNCAKVLRTAKRPAPGKKIKCPGCEEIFAPAFDDDETTEAVEIEPPRSKAKPAAATRDEEEEDAKPRRPAAKREDDEEDEKPRRKKARAVDEEEDADDSDDDRPRKKKKAKKKSNVLMLALVIGGGFFVALSCGLLGVGAWVWPGFLISSTNNNDIQAYIPISANQIFGIDTKAVSQQGQLDFALKWLETVGPLKDRPLPTEVMELIRDSEKLIIAVQSGRGPLPQTYIAILAKDTAAVDKFKAAAGLGAPERLEKRHNIYRTGKKAAAKWTAFVAMPGDRLVLLNNLPEDSLLELLKRGEKPDEKQSGALTFSKVVDQSPVWTAWAVPTMGAVKAPPKMQANMPAPGMAGPEPKGGSMAAEFAQDHWKVHFRIELSSEAEATKMKGLLDLQKGMIALGAPPAIAKDIKTLVAEVQGSTVSIRIQMSPQTIEEIGKMPKGAF
jgi:hypothetical protein